MRSVGTQQARRQRGSAAVTLVAVLAGIMFGLAAAWHDPASGGDAKALALEDQVATALRTADYLEREALLLGALEELSPETLPAIRAGYEREHEFTIECDLAPFIAGWSRFDPGAASAYVKTWEKLERRSWGMRQIAYAMGLAARHDEVVSLLGELTQGRVADPARAFYVEGRTRAGDLAGANAYLLELPEGNGRNRVVESLLRAQLIEGGVPQALSWFETILPALDKQQKRDFAGLTARWTATADPEQASAWFEARPDEDYWMIVPTAVGEQWTEVDPESAIAWVMRVTKPGQRGRFAVARLIKRFAGTHPDRAERFLDGQKAQPRIQEAIPEIIVGLQDVDPPQALGWAQQLEDEALRDEALTTVLKRWATSEPESAASWLTETELSDADRTKLEAALAEVAS
ncbi:MAG: hypothetical protein AAF430_16340 [Myxococcota bacterium]